MALDRQTIEKKDFPIGRRGYDPQAVDAHLAVVADEVESLRRQAQRRGGETLASTASGRVQAIIEAAEASAEEIERAAEEEAATIRREAQSSADRARQEALDRSRSHVGEVNQVTSAMLQRVEAMESELATLVDGLRTGANRLTADLSLLEGNMDELREAAGQPEGEPVGEPAPSRAAPPRSTNLVDDPGDPELEDLDEPEAGPGTPGRGATEEPAAEPARPTSAGADADPGADEDVEGARLIALNMALNGQSRRETDRYLSENFELTDRDALLDEVYASVEG
ncbi:MAG TPA: DivIVA domain-containing protein [Solirubrobacteraceae bacterium]|nr:DivIVA domain-containing protein [Solirubrobacteraceae bacterium]